MDFKKTDISDYIKQHLYILLRINIRFVWKHPLLSSSVLLLLLVHKFFPSLFAFLVSSSPVVLLTSILLGTLLSYGQTKRRDNNTPSEIHSEMSHMKAEHSPVNYRAKVIDGAPLQNELVVTDISREIEIENGSYDEVGKALHAKEAETAVRESGYFISAHPLLAVGNTSTKFEESTMGVSESYNNGNTQNTTVSVFDNTNANKENPSEDNSFVDIFGSAWKPLPARHAEFESESELDDSSSEGDSMTDIMPMLEELTHQMEAKHTDYAATSTENFDGMESSGDDNSGETDKLETFGVHHNLIERDEYIDAYGETENGNRESYDEIKASLSQEKYCSVDSINICSSEPSRKNGAESLIDRRKAKKSVSFDQLGMEKLSGFHVRVPRIATPRPVPADLFDNSDVPGSAPSVLSSQNNLSDLLSDEAGRPYSQTWSPRTFSQSNRRDFAPTSNENENFCNAVCQRKNISRFNPSYDGRNDRFKQNHNDLEPLSYYTRSHDDETEQKNLIFGSLERKLSEELKILSSAFSEAGKLDLSFDEADDDLLISDHLNGDIQLATEVNLSSSAVDTFEDENVPSSNPLGCTSELQTHAVDGHHSMSASVSNYSEMHAVEDASSNLHVIEASSIKLGGPKRVLEPIMDGPVATIHENRLAETMKDTDEQDNTFHAPAEDDAENRFSSSELHVVEASSIEEIKLFFKQIQGQLHGKTAQETSSDCGNSTHEINAATQSSELHVVEATSLEELNVIFKQLQQQAWPSDTSEAPSNFLNHLNEMLAQEYENNTMSSSLHVVEASSREQIRSLFRQLDRAAKNVSLTRSTVEVEQLKSSHEPLGGTCSRDRDALQSISTTSSGMTVVEACSVEQINSLFERLNEEAHEMAASENLSSRENMISEALFVNAEKSCPLTELHVIEANSAEELKSLIHQFCQEAQDDNAGAVNENPLKLEAAPSKFYSSEMAFVEANSVEDIDSAFANISLGNRNINEVASERFTADKEMSELHVVEASSEEEMKSIIHQFCQEEQEDSAGVDNDNPIRPEGAPSNLCSSELPANPSSKMAFVDASSVEDIDSALAKILSGHGNIYVVGSERTSCRENKMNELHVIEASSAEEMKSCIHQFCQEEHENDGVVDKDLIKFETSPSNLFSSELQATPSSEMALVDANSIDDIDAALATICFVNSSKTELAPERSSRTENKMSELHVIEASSAEEMKSLIHQFCKVEQEDNTKVNADNSIEREAAPSNLCSSELPVNPSSKMVFIDANSIDDIDAALATICYVNSSTTELASERSLSENKMSDLHVIEASSAEEMKSLIHQFCKVQQGDHTGIHAEISIEREAAPSNLCSSELEANSLSDMAYVNANSVEDIDSALEKIRFGLGNASEAVPESSSRTENNMSCLHVIEASSAEEMKSLIHQFSQVAHEDHSAGVNHENMRNLKPALTNVSSSEHPARPPSEIAFIDAKSVEDIDSALAKIRYYDGDINEAAHQLAAASERASCVQNKSELHVIEASSLEEITSLSE